MIIYEANETDFFNNGLGTLPDATSALVTEERNGEFVLDVIYPQQGLRSELLTKSRIIKADAGHELKDQRFVIKKVTPTMDSDGYIYLTVHAEHVSYITADLGVTPNLTLSGNATQALEQWQANLVGGHPDIVVDSDIISEHETNLDITKATNARQVLGGVEGSILDTWGGEYKFDNLHISLRGQRGTTANTLISYGRNLLTFEQEDDITDTYTSIYPYANVGLADGNNSKLVTVDGYFVDSQYVDRYPNRKLLPVDFGSEFTDYKIGSKPSESDTGIYTTEAEIKKKLVELAKQYIENNRIGIPKVSTKITFADLSKTSEYAPLEQVNLCDIIPIRFEKLGIDTTIKVTRVVWNVLLDEYDSIELGDLRTTLGESISALESKTTGLANAVITAQSTADNQNSIFRTNGGTTEPVAKKTGDLWFKTDGDYQYMYQWDGAVWREVVNTKTTDDIAKEVDQARVKMEELVKKANDDTTIFRTEGQEAAPTVKKKGDLWFKADNGQTVMNEWDGQKWHEIVSTKTTEDITKQVEQAQADAEALSSEVESAKKQAQEAFAKAGFNADEINNVKTATSEVTETLTSTVRQTSELSESLKNVASETASRYSTVSSELSGARDSLNAKASELASEVASNSANITKANSQLYSQSEGLAKVSQSATKMEQTMTDLSGRVHTVETTASETKEALADAKGNITTLTKRADGTDTKIADAQGRVQTLESRADNWDLELSKKVDNTTYNAGIQNLGNQINLKANKSDLDGYATKAQLSVESDRITQQASAISSVTTIANGANLKIDNLSFGGRNLLDRSDGQFVMGNGITNTTWENGKAVLRYNSADVSRSSEILPQSADFGLQFPVARGEQLTQSIYLDTDANINFNNNFEFSWFDFKDGHKLVRANIDKIGQNTYRLWGNYTWDKNDSSNLRIMDIANLYKVVDFRNSGTYLAFYHPQIERSSRPSDYSLSQNDLQRLASENTASQISQYNTGTVQPIKGIANDALGKANTANNKIDGLKIGSRNLLKGTSDQFKTITAWGWMNAHTYSNYPYVDLSNFHTGDYLTYSVWVTNTSDVPIRAEIYCFDKNKGHTHTALSAVINPNNSNWLVVTMPIESNDRYARPSVITTSGQIGSHIIRMREEMLTLGNVRLPWQPSDLDLPDTIITTVTTTTNAKQIVDNSGIYSEVAKLVDTKVGGVTTQLNSYKHTVDDTGNKLRDVMGALKLDSNGNLTSNFNELIKTASGVEERYTQLNGKIDGLGGGVNLARGTKRDLQNANVAGTWLFIGYNTSSYFNDLSSYQGKHITVRVWIERPTADAWVQIYTNKGTIGGNHIKAGQSGYSTASGVIPTGITSWNIPIGGGAPTMSFGWKEFKIELGEIATPWTPAFEDISTEISKTNETIKTVDGTVATVKNNLDKTKSIVTQLSNLFGVNVGDSSISVTNGGVLVIGKQISIDGNTYIKDASIDGAKIKSLDAGKITTGTLNAAKLNVINLNADSINAGTLSGAYLHITKDSYIDNASIDGAKIKSLDAGKITTGTLNAASVKVINLDANNIKTGTLSGNNLSLNLDDGTVSFKKGKIVSSNNKLILNIDDGSLAVGDASKRQGMMFNQGKMYMYDQGYFGNSTWNGNVYDWILEMKKHPYAVLEYSSSFSGTSGSLFGGSGANFHSTSGVAIAYDKNVSQTASAGTTSGIFDDWNPLDGHGVFINENGIAMGAEDKLVSIVGGTSFRYGQQSIWNYKPTILVGTNLWTDNVYDHGYNINKLTSDGSNIYMQASALITDTSAAIFNVKNGDVEFAIKGNDRNVIINASGHTSNGLIVKGSQNITNWLGCQDLSVRGNKNSVVQTSQGWTKINAYETAEYYFGDLGTAVTDDTSTVRIGIEPLFNETVNTDIPYQVFVTSYGEGYAWVAERGSNYFVIKSSVPNLEIGYEIKAKRKGYENVRLEIDKHMEINK